MPRLAATARARAPVLTNRWQAEAADHVIALRWSPAGDQIAAAAVSGPITLLDAATGQTRRQLPGHALGACAVDWHPDGLRLASSGQDGFVRLWDAASGAELNRMPGGAAWVEHTAWSPSGNILASAAGRVLRFWDPTGEPIVECADHPSTIAAIAWKPGGLELASAAYGLVTVWSPTSPKPVKQFAWKGASLALAWSPDGRYLATGDQDATVHFWIVAKERDLQMWGYPNKVRELSWDTDSRYLATGGGPTPVVWDCSGRGPSGTKPLTLEYHTAPLTLVAFQRRGRLLVTAAQDGQLAVWDLKQPRRPKTTLALPSAASQAAWSPDDTHLAVGCESGAVLGLTLE